jgi:hypothetical protein
MGQAAELGRAAGKLPGSAVKSETPEGPRIIDAAERARLHERYIDKFTADALALGLKPGSGKFMAFVVD